MDKKRYWLRGGVILPIIVIIAFLIYQFVWVPLYTDSLLFLILLFIPGGLLSWPLSSRCFLAGFDGVNNCPVNQSTYLIILIVASLIAYFLIGTLGGFIYGKFKNKKLAPRA